MQIASKTVFKRWVLIPSRSVLCLIVKLEIVVLMVAGEVMPRVISGGLGFGGTKASGSLLEWFIQNLKYSPLLLQRIY